MTPEFNKQTENKLERLNRRLKNFKIWYVFLLLIFIATLLFAIQGFWIHSEDFKIVVKELAAGLLVAGIVGLTFEVFIRRESRNELQLLFQTEIESNSEALLNLMPIVAELNPDAQAALFSLLIQPHDDQITAMSAENCKEIISALIGHILRDGTIAKSLTAGVLHPIANSQTLWQGARVEATLFPVDEGDAMVKAKCFDIEVDYRYKAKLKRPDLLFLCTRTTDEHNQTLMDEDIFSGWMFPSQKLFPKINHEVFRVLFVKVGGVDLHRKRTRRKNCLVYTHDDLKNLVGEVVDFHYRIRAKINKLGHLFAIHTSNPTFDISITLDYSRVPIKHVNVLDFFQSAKLPIIVPTPHERPEKMEVSIKEEWVFPKGGVAFVWVLKSEFEAAIKSYESYSETPVALATTT